MLQLCMHEASNPTLQTHFSLREMRIQIQLQALQQSQAECRRVNCFGLSHRAYLPDKGLVSPACRKARVEGAAMKELEHNLT